MEFQVDKFGVTAYVGEKEHNRLDPIGKFGDAWFPVHVKTIGTTNIREYTIYQGKFTTHVNSYNCSVSGSHDYEVYANTTIDDEPLVQDQFYRFERVGSGVTYVRDVSDVMTCLGRPYYYCTLRNDFFEESDRFVISSTGMVINLVSYDGQHTISIQSVDDSAVEQFYNKAGDNLTNELYISNCKIIFSNTSGRMSRADGPACYHMPEGIKFSFVNGSLVGCSSPVVNTMWVYNGVQLSMAKVMECAKKNNALVNYTGICFEGPAYRNDGMKKFIEDNYKTMKK